MKFSAYLIWVWKTTQTYLYRLQFHVSPSGDTPAPSSCWYSWPPLYPCTTFDTHHWETFLHGCPPKKPQGLSAGSDSWCLRTLKHFSDQGQSAPSQATVSRADCLCTLNDTPGTFQGYWEREQEVSWFKNGTQLKLGGNVLPNELIASIS